MANWEYKVLSSGKHGMATMAALEQHLNDLGQQQWEIINWHTAPDNPLLFTGLARRPILRDWKPEEMPSAQSAAREKAEEDNKERAAWRDTLKEELEFVTERENEIEDDPVADTEDLLDMLVPMMRRSQRGSGSVGAISFLARKLNQSDDDLLGALAEAGLKLEEDPNVVPASIEHDGDYFWLNRNQRGEPWLNSGPRPPSLKPKNEPRPPRAARDDSAAGDEPSSSDEPQDSPAPDSAADGDSSTSATAPAAPAAPANSSRHSGREPREPRDPRERRDSRDQREPRHDRGEQGGRRDDGAAQPLPEGEALLNRLRPMMRRNRRGRGLSGSISYLSRALRHSDADLSAALAKLGLILPADAQAKPVFVEIGNLLYWLNLGQGGQIWINTREKRAGETAESAHADDEGGSAPADGASAGASAPTPSPAPAGEVTPGSEPLAAPAANESESSAAPAAVVSEPAGEPAGESRVQGDPIFARIRPHFSKNKRGAAFSATPGAVADALGLSQADLVESLVKAGLEVPDREDSKAVFAEHDGEIFWFNRNAKDELWLNAKAKQARRGRGAGRGGARKSEGEDEGDVAE